MSDSALDRGDKNPIHTLARKRLGESDARIPRCGRNSKKHLGELSCAARLFFVAIIRLGARFDRFAKAHARLDQVEMHIESAPKPIGNNLEVEFALRGDNSLVQFRV